MTKRDTLPYPFHPDLAPQLPKSFCQAQTDKHSD